MKRAVLVLVASLAAITSAFAANPADFGQVKTVYLFPMGQAFEQYLANQLTMQGVFEVVTDPLKADAVFTDEIGQRFEKQFEDVYPPPPVEVKKEKTTEAKKDDKAEEKDAQDPIGLVGEVEPLPVSSFARGKGNLFLVGRESRRVLWSTFHRPKSTSTKELNSAAMKIVGQLKEKLPAR